MIKDYDIITAFTRAIKTKIKNTDLDTDILIDKEKLQAFDNKKKACFFVEKHDINTEVGTFETNKENTIIDVFYYPTPNENIKKLYEISDTLILLFSRNISVKDEIIDIANIETNILSDEVGKYLHLAITLEYFNLIVDFVEYEYMQEIDIVKGDK